MNNILIILLPRAECYLAQKEKLQDEGEVTHSQGTHSNLVWFLWHSIVQCSQATVLTACNLLKVYQNYISCFKKYRSGIVP